MTMAVMETTTTPMARLSVAPTTITVTKQTPPLSA
jgi:hypothetical protein